MKEDLELDQRLRELATRLRLSRADQRAIDRLSTIPSVATQRESVAPHWSLPGSTGSGSRRRAIRRAAAVALALGIIIGGNLAAAYYSPGYGDALAQAPALGAVSERVLRAVGLSSETISPINSIDISSGHSLKLVGGYADPTRTVLLIEIDGQPPALLSKSSRTYIIDGYLTDQFGHTYHEVSGPEQGIATRFEPLVWPASSFGARLTLHISQLRPSWVGGSIAGTWTLHATLIRRPVHVLSLPAPIDDPEIVYTFVSLRSSRALEVKWSVSGPAAVWIRQKWGLSLNQNSSSTPVLDEYGLLIEDYLQPHLVDAAGHRVPITNYGFNFGLPISTGPVEGELDVILPGPGQYELWFGTSSSRRTIQVPAE